ncbi:hypothetical protein ACGFI4_09970 [Micromonospora carbonacea]|uniref:hypothetical protein n=1 Tax=Micromonospora carbonacea TaxID=47853 RepID=UPI00371C7DB3
MTEPITLAMGGGVLLAEGVRFLYDQAGELLRHRREQRDEAAAPPHVVALPERVFDGQLADPWSARLWRGGRWSWCPARRICWPCWPWTGPTWWWSTIWPATSPSARPGPATVSGRTRRLAG